MPMSKVLKECSISCTLGDVVHDKLAEVLLVSGLEVFEDGWLELPSEEVSNDELSVPLELVLSQELLIPVMGNWAKILKTH